MRRCASADVPCHAMGRRPVLDIIYIAVTVAFFVLMLAYVHGLDTLGRDPALQDKEQP